MAQYMLPVPGEFYIFPAWQPHSVAPFRGEGERWSMAFNAVAVPHTGRPMPPAPAQPVMGPAQPVMGNVSLSTSRARPGGFG